MKMRRRPVTCLTGVLFNCRTTKGTAVYMYGIDIDEKLPALKEQRAATASQLSICHNSNSVSKEISFIPENQMTDL